MLSSLCIWAGPQFAPRGCSSQRTCCSSWRLTIHIVHLKQPQDKKTNDLWDLEKCLQRCQSHSGVCRLVFDLGRCKNSVSAITLTFMLIGNPQSLICIQREQRQQQRDFKESDLKLLPWKVCVYSKKNCFAEFIHHITLVTCEAESLLRLRKTSALFPLTHIIVAQSVFGGQPAGPGPGWQFTWRLLRSSSNQRSLPVPHLSAPLETQRAPGTVVVFSTSIYVAVM